ncbi:MAG: CDP-alcohol phosphatidyltransferase family protein [Tannerellaceae bacterium]
MKQDTPSLASSLKSADTEEFIDLLFYRPIGYRWALLFRQMGVTPNAVTILSIFLGVAAGILFYYTNLWLNVVGMLLLVWANMYDSADGQLARMTGQKSEIGRILDGVSGDCWFIAIYVAICLRLTPEWGIWIWLLAAVAGFCHSKQAALADYYRNIHLLFLKGKAGSEFDNSRQQREKFRSMSWGGNLISKLFCFFYTNYTASQEQLTPRFQRLFTSLQQRYGDQVPQEWRDRFRAYSLPLMKYTNILSFNTRVIALFICILLNIPWAYFVFELVVMNALLIYMRWRHESLCRDLFAEDALR